MLICILRQLELMTSNSCNIHSYPMVTQIWCNKTKKLVKTITWYWYSCRVISLNWWSEWVSTTMKENIVGHRKEACASIVGLCPCPCLIHIIKSTCSFHLFNLFFILFFKYLIPYLQSPLHLFIFKKTCIQLFLLTLCHFIFIKMWYMVIFCVIECWLTLYMYPYLPRNHYYAYMHSFPLLKLCALQFLPPCEI